MASWRHFIAVLMMRKLFGLVWILLIVLILISSRLSLFAPAARSISVFTWPQIIDRDMVNQFEKETGIKVYLSYYESNEELFSKLHAQRGAGYDLVVPSDYEVQIMIKDGLLKKIDKSKLDFLPRIDPKLMHKYFDRGNEYSVPYFWGTYGLGVDLNYFKGKSFPQSWALLFDPAYAPSSVGMIEGPREGVLIAAQYLFGSTDNLNDPARIEAIKKLLVDQKSRVKAYTEWGVEYLLMSKAAPVVVTDCAEIERIKTFAPNITFILPEEGGFLLIDSLALTSQTKKDDLVYQFINFLYRPEVISYHRIKFGMCPPTNDPQSPEEQNLFCPTDAQFAKMSFFKADIPERLFTNIWLTLMSQ